MSSKFARDFETVMRRCGSDIFEWCKLLNFNPTHQQAELLKSVQEMHRIEPTKRKKKRIAVKSGQGPGKTSCSTVIAGWRQIRYPGTRTVVTAPTARQCEEIFIQEFARRVSDAQPIVRQIFKDINAKRISTCGIKGWDILTATATSPTKLQGFHHPHLMFIGEEASGIERGIIEQIKGTLSQDDNVLLLIGNPNFRDCAFFDAFYKEDTWITHTFNAEESPIVNQDHVKALEREYGRDSDIYRVRVLGEFPKADPDSILSGDDVRACTKTDKYALAAVRVDTRQYKQFGIDFARFGSDESVIYQRQGNAILDWARFSKTEPMDVIDRAFVMQHDALWENSETLYVGDAGGLGGGVMAVFHRAGKQIHEFHNNGTSSNPAFANKISEAWFCLRELVKKRKAWIPDDPQLLRELETRKYSTNNKGQILVESKDKFADRLETNSPDRSDALVMAFYSGGAASGTVTSAVTHSPTLGAKVRRG